MRHQASGFQHLLPAIAFFDRRNEVKVVAKAGSTQHHYIQTLIH
jgi:hypothetical protein